MSSALTAGIRVDASSFYVPGSSKPDEGYYFFSYRIRITNVGELPARLISRHWVIKNAFGAVEHVKGPGVVGKTPTLQPGESFEYQSACPLNTPTGSMEGTYRMVRDDGEYFDARIERFVMMIPELLN